MTPEPIPPLTPPQPDPGADIAPDSSSPRQRLTLGWAVCLIVAILFMLDVFVPWNTTFSTSVLDASWCLTLHWAFLKGLDFAHDVVFTYGPWGFIIQGFVPSTFKFTVMGWSLFGFAFVAGIWPMARRITSKWPLGLLWMLLLISLACSTIQLLQDVRMYSMSWLLVLLYFYFHDKPRIGAKVLLTVAMALASLIKFAFVFMALAALIPISLDALRRRRVPWWAAIYLASYLCLWLAAGQTLANLPLFLSNSWNITSGYAQAMGSYGPTEVADLSLYLFCGITPLLGVVALAHRHGITQSTSDEQKKNSPSPALAFLALLAMLFISFKAGYVRHDFHEAIATTSLLILCLLYCASLSPAIRSLVGRFLMGYSILWAVALTWRSYTVVCWEHRWLTRDLEVTASHMGENARIAGWWVTRDSRMSSLFEDELLTLNNVFPLKKTSATVDVYPWAGGLALAGGLPYQPRPVLQSYQAYTSHLADLDADFLRSDKAADEIFFRVAPIDGRFPSLDDSTSWPLLLTRYDLLENDDLFFRLKRSSTPRDYSLIPITTAHGQFDQPVSVPIGGPDPVWINIHLTMTPTGKLLQMIYRPPRIDLNLRTIHGVSLSFHLVPELAEHGFLLSPIVRDNHSFAMLYSNHWRESLDGATVVGMSLTLEDDPGAALSYEKDYTVDFSALHYPRFDVSAVPGINNKPSREHLQTWGG